MKTQKLTNLFLFICMLILALSCKNPLGGDEGGSGGGSGGMPIKGWYMDEKGGVGYKGEIKDYITNSSLNLNKVELWAQKSGNYHYRIPVLVQLSNGHLLAFADRRIGKVADLPNTIEIVMKRSVDNGTNWSAEQLISPHSTKIEESYGDSAFVVDRKTGNIICIVASGPGFLAPTKEQPYGSTPSDPVKIKVIKSMNNGSNWTNPVDITDQIYGPNSKHPERKTWHGLFVTSGNGVQLRNGRIMFVMNVRKSSANMPLYNHVLYSDDGGNTWNVSEAPGISQNQQRGGSEAKIVELNNGDLLMAIRPESKQQRFLAKSTDSGTTWGEMYPKSEMISSSSNGDIIYYTSKDNGFDTNIILTMFGAKTSQPGNPTLYYSFDEGNTWKGKEIFNGNAGYSSLAILKDGSIGILAEMDRSWQGPIYFMRVNMHHLTDGQYKGPYKVSE